MLADVTELEPGKTYWVQTQCQSNMELQNYCDLIRNFVPDGVHVVVAGISDTVREQLILPVKNGD